MPCNVVSNPSFESGLDGWHTNLASAVKIITSDVAYDGNSFVSLDLNTDRPTGDIHTYLYDLDTAKSYDLKVQVRVNGDLPSVNQCTFSVEANDDPAGGVISSDYIWTAGEWIQLNGTYTPSVRDTEFKLAATCHFSGDVQALGAAFDDVILSDC
ncbi:uncharacterized protein BJX67DRAFT_385424 [Aspergillus lucknowensis]|uniref:CBM-cenC domain-containing protein n=1 Tax=Aspergillus lucknowensis TaxID=176173 RepID=A0ABR4LDK1_9EURO